MSKVLLLSHAYFSQEAYNAIQLIMGKVDERVSYLTLPYGVDIDQYQKQIEQKVEEAGKEGILILTDLFGGSPFMVSARVYQKYHDTKPMEIVTGLNLPMLAELMVNLDKTAAELKQIAMEAGKQGVVDFTKKL